MGTGVEWMGSHFIDKPNLMCMSLSDTMACPKDSKQARHARPEVNWQGALTLSKFMHATRHALGSQP